MQKNLSRFERAVRVCVGLAAIFLAMLVYVHPVSRIIAGVFGLYLLWEASAAKCYGLAMLGVSKESDRLGAEKASVLGLAFVQLVIAYEWFFAGWEKIASGTFATGLAKTFAYFATKNPYLWYRSFLLGAAMDKSYLLGQAVQWGEVLTGLGLALAAIGVMTAKDRWRKKTLCLSALALVAGMLMSLNFYLAAGWTGAGTSGDNVVMFWAQAALLFVWAETSLSLRKK